MRLIIWLLMIFAAAVAVAIFAPSVQNPWVVHFIMTDNRYELAFNAFILFAVFAFIFGYILIRILVNILNLPTATRRWNALRRERYSHVELNEAILQYLAGRYSRALKNAKKALKAFEKNRTRNEKIDGTIEFGTLAHLLAAASEHRLKNNENSVQQLQKALQLSEKSNLTDAPDGILLLQAQWHLENNNTQAAQAAMQKLDAGAARRIAALQLQLQIDRQASAAQPALLTAKQLAKHKAYEPQQAQQIINELSCKVIDSAASAEQVHKLLDSLDAKDRKQPEVVAQAAKKLALFNDAPNACKLIATCWNDIDILPAPLRQKILLILDMSISGADSAWLKRLEQSLTNNPEDPMLTYLTGRICEQQNIDGRAQSLLEKAAQNTALLTPLRQKAWLALAQLAEQKGNTTKANTCYKEAALLLNS